MISVKKYDRKDVLFHMNKYDLYEVFFYALFGVKKYVFLDVKFFNWVSNLQYNTLMMRVNVLITIFSSIFYKFYILS